MKRVVLVLLLAALSDINAGSRPRPPLDDASVDRRDAVHRYRVVGKVRLLFFWVSADDVGGARITWQGGEEPAVSLLIGSEPRRAPRGINEWGYIRELVTGDSTVVFGIRTVTDGGSPGEAEARRTAPGRLAEVGVLCSRVTPLEAASRTTTVSVAREATYRDIDQVLDAAERSTTRWSERQVARPSNVRPGFLSALDRMMRSSAAAARETGASSGPFAYVYKDAVYDLIPGRMQAVPSLRTPSGSFSRLLRNEIVVRNRATGSTSGFSITYGTEGSLSGVPVTAVYQPNWWFKVELELDEDQDVPPDPAAEASISGRIAALCAPVDQ